MVAWRASIALVMATTVACSSVRPIPVRYIAERTPSTVYVAYVDGERGVVREMSNPHVVGDSLYGTWTEGNRPAAVPVQGIHRVSTMRRDPGRTALLVAGLAGVSAVFGYVIFGTANGHNDWDCDYSPNRRGPAGEPFCGPRESL